MPITVTIHAESFSELFTLIRDIPVGNVVDTATQHVPSVQQVGRGVRHTEGNDSSLQVVSSTDVLKAEYEVDAEGTPWNAEIHSSSKAKTEAGVWRKRRGGGEVQMPHTASAAVVNTVAPTYADIAALCSQKMTTGALNGAVLGTLQMEFGIDNMTMLIGKPELIPAFHARIAAL